MVDKESSYVVVWSGRDSLIPDREEHQDSRINAMPSFDLDDDMEVKISKPPRKYNRTGRHRGEFSRTNPLAAHYKPSKKEQS